MKQAPGALSMSRASRPKTERRPSSAANAGGALIPYAGRERRAWTAEQDALIALAAYCGWPSSAAAKALGRGKGAVIGRASRMGVRFTGSPGRPKHGA